jgi:heat shock protein HtpX
MKGNAWLLSRVALALTLMVAFYALALSISFGLLWLGYAQVRYAHTINPKLLLITVGGGLLIIWAIIPRPDKFVPPGPRVTPASEPELFKLVQAVAVATRQPMPDELYIVNDVNAFVTQCGGVMGFGSRRVMGVGLPLMQAVSVQEFTGILAHEFGHYHAGDVALGPWIYKTRTAIGRTIHKLSGTVLQKVFVWYGTLFLRITQAVSRRQEFIADEIAARVAGAGPMISSLRKTHGAALAFQSYWQSELAPVLRSGYLPPITRGFAHFMQADRVASGIHSVVKLEESGGTTDPFDTHPSLRDRVSALSGLTQGSAGDTRTASDVLIHIDEWERRVLGAAVNPEWAHDLKPLAWAEVVETIYVPMYRKQVHKHTALLRDFTASTIPTSGVELARLGASLLSSDDGVVDDHARAARMIALIAAGLTLALFDCGWIAETTPGDEILVRRDGHEVRAMTELNAVLSGTTTPAQWRERCHTLGIAALRLCGDQGS